ncbi:MAG: hypothetical protein JWO07_799, partial [Candidatus Saccharibacteria bacterium]|nr:hypothetical protein [Candidatus Saccharibacteria bacterium]
MVNSAMDFYTPKTLTEISGMSRSIAHWIHRVSKHSGVKRRRDAKSWHNLHGLESALAYRRIPPNPSGIVWSHQLSGAHSQQVLIRPFWSDTAGNRW